MDELRLQVQGILDTLPITYYCDTSTSIVLTDEAMTYYRIDTHTIHISFPMIVRALKKTKATETLIRGLVYHELGHAMCTPTDLFTFSPSEDIKNEPEAIKVLNIIEDERIERTLDSYFMNVDFRSNFQLVSGIENPNEPQGNLLDNFLNFVRNRIGPSDCIKKLESLLDETMGLELHFSTLKYREKCFELYAYWKEHCGLPKSNMSNETPCDDDAAKGASNSAESSSGTKTDVLTDCDVDALQSWLKGLSPSEKKVISSYGSSPEGTTTDPSYNSEQECEEANQNEGEPSVSANMSSNSDNNHRDPAQGLTESEVRDFIENLQFEDILSAMNMDKWDIQNFVEWVLNKQFVEQAYRIQERIKVILQRIKKKQGQAAPVVASYSGRFNSRNTTRKDYRYFEFNSEKSKHRGEAKLKLNLFIDNSGSFWMHSFITNLLLRCLREVEKQTELFEYDVILIVDSGKDKPLQITPKERRYCNPDRGNSFCGTGLLNFNRVQKRQAETLNIILFDGPAFPSKQCKLNSKIFNRSNCHIIVSNTDDNFNILKRTCPQAKLTRVPDYTSNFIDSVLSALEQWAR